MKNMFLVFLGLFSMGCALADQSQESIKARPGQLISFHEVHMAPSLNPDGSYECPVLQGKAVSVDVSEDHVLDTSSGFTCIYNNYYDDHNSMILMGRFMLSNGKVQLYDHEKAVFIPFPPEK